MLKGYKRNKTLYGDKLTIGAQTNKGTEILAYTKQYERRKIKPKE